MHWNYRVIEFVDLDGEPYRQIHEVYYDDDGRPSFYTERGAEVCGDDQRELRECLRRMTECLQKPVLVETDFQRSSDG